MKIAVNSGILEGQMQRAEILKAAMELPEDEREKLAEELDQLVHGDFANPEIEEAWAAEVERRIDEVDSGQVKTIPWPEARAQVLERLRQIRGR